MEDTDESVSIISQLSVETNNPLYNPLYASLINIIDILQGYENADNNRVCEQVCKVLLRDGFVTGDFIQCITCLSISREMGCLDITYNIDDNNTFIRRHFPLTPLQVLYGCVIVMILKFHGHDTEMVPVKPYYDHYDMGCVEIVCGYNVWYLTEFDIMYQDYNNTPVASEQLAYDKLVLAIQKVTPLNPTWTSITEYLLKLLVLKH